MVAYSTPSSSPSITGVPTKGPSRTGTGTMRRTISPAVPYSVCDPHYFVAYNSHQPRTVHDVGETNAEVFGAELEVSPSL